MAGLEENNPPLGELRRRSKGAIELTDLQGRRRTLQFDEMTDADQALAEKFGYQPVSTGNSRDSSKQQQQQPPFLR